MIAYLHGTVLEQQPPMLVLNVAGVGYEIEMPLGDFNQLPERGGQLELFIHMVVREDAQLLFGFRQRNQRELFRSLIKISGVGPKVALAVLSTLSPAELVQCANQQDVAMLSRVPGIGTKTAQRILVELKDKLADQMVVTDDASIKHQSDSKGEAVLALEALGFKRQQVIRVVNSLDGSLSSEDLIRLALRELSGRVLERS